MRDVLFKHLHDNAFIVIRATVMTVMSCNDVFKSSWEVDIYELGSCNYDVWCNQVALVGAI